MRIPRPTCRLALFVLVPLLLAAAPVQAEPKLLTFKDVLAFPHGPVPARIAYGPDPLQFGELWMPAGAGPHPLVVMIHGGCWRADLPGLELQRPLSEALARHGWAVWNLEYRRIGHAGGAWPGTFADIAAGVDAVRGLARAHQLDLSRVVFMGHSAGGHLATWAAARPRLPRTSPLWRPDPLVPAAVLSLAGLTDLETYHDEGPDACGGPTVVENLVAFADRGAAAYADTSPARLLPLHVRQLVVSAEHDHVAPPWLGERYAAAAKRAGDPVEARTFAAAGHFELIDPKSAAWAQLFAALDGLAPSHSPKPGP